MLDAGAPSTARHEYQCGIPAWKDMQTYCCCQVENMRFPEKIKGRVVKYYSLTKQLPNLYCQMWIQLQGHQHKIISSLGNICLRRPFWFKFKVNFFKEKEAKALFFISKVTSCKFSLNLTRSAMTLGAWESENWMERKWMKDTDSERAQGKTDQQGWKRSTKERSIQGRWRPGGHGSFSRRTDSDKAQAAHTVLRFMRAPR